MTLERISYNNEPIIAPPISVDTLYDQNRNELNDIPQTTLIPEKENQPNMPGIFNPSVEGFPAIWIPGKAVPPRFIFVEKADDGGVGGHVEASMRLKATILDHVLRYNRWKNNNPIFTSLMATHTGDDVAITGIIDESVMEHQEVVAELMWDAFKKGEKVALEQGLYGPGQDLKVDAFTCNTHGMGPAIAILPLPARGEKDKPSQVVVVAYADKTEPGVYNHITTRSYLDPNFNTGLLIADSKMNRGYIFEITDLNTKARAYEEGIPHGDQKVLDETMNRLGKTERTIQLSAPEDYYNICRLTMDGSRYVVSKIFTKEDNGKPGQLGVVVSAERLHNIPSKDGKFSYGGKDDPVMVSLAQGDWPAPGEITSPMSLTPVVAGDCRGSHNLNIFPMPINGPTSYFSGPIMSILSMSVNIHSGKIGAVSDQFARGTPWDKFRDDAARKAKEFRDSQGFRQPGTLPTDEMEYQSGYVKHIKALSSRFQIRDVK